MNGFDFFEKIYCINLDSRPDRWEKMQKEFNRWGIKEKVERVSGYLVEGMTFVERGEKGCSLSHVHCLRDGYEKGYNNILVFEDDVFFSDNTNEQLTKSISELPRDWGLFQLGFCPSTDKAKFSKHSQNLIRLDFECFCAHAVGYSKNVINHLMNTPEYFIRERAYDVLLAKYIHPKFRCFSTNPPIVNQNIKRESNISLKRTNYDWYIDLYNDLSDQMDTEKIKN